MAKLKMLCVYDKKADAFNLPMCYPSLGVGIRDFSDAFTKADNPMAKHRDDFQLYYIGEFDTADAVVESVSPAKLVFSGVDIGE